MMSLYAPSDADLEAARGVEDVVATLRERIEMLEGRFEARESVSLPFPLPRFTESFMGGDGVGVLGKGGERANFRTYVDGRTEY
jgi:hypothetical protein